MNYPLDITEDQMNEWKIKHGSVFYFGIEGEEKGEIGGYFARPSKDVLKVSQKHFKDGKEYDALETLYANCKLFVSKDVETNDHYKRSIYAKFGTLIKESEVTEKKF